MIKEKTKSLENCYSQTCPKSHRSLVQHEKLSSDQCDQIWQKIWQKYSRLVISESLDTIWQNYVSTLVIFLLVGQLSLLLIAKYWINNVAIRSHWLRTPKKRFPNLKISKMDANWGQKIWPKKKRVEKINWSNNRAVNRETKILTHSSTGRSVPFHKFGELWKVEKDENKQKRGRIGSFKKEIKWITRRMFVKWRVPWIGVTRLSNLCHFGKLF